MQESLRWLAVLSVRKSFQFSVKGIHTHYDRAHGDNEVKSKYSSGHNGKYHSSEWKTAVQKGSL